MKKLSHVLLFVAFVSLLGACAGGTEVPERSGEEAVSGPPIAVQKVIPFANRAGIRLEVKKQCRLEKKTPKFVKYFAPEHNVNVKMVDDLDRTDIDRKLEIVITNAHAPAGGGMFAGDMWMRVKATLTENGERVAVGHFRRETSGGYWDEFKSTCAIVGRCTEAIGDDIAAWLKNPEDGAFIGNFPNRQPSPGMIHTPGPGAPNPPGPL